MDAASHFMRPEHGFQRRWRMTALHVTFAVMLFAVAVRLIGIEARPLWLDEGYSAWFSSLSWRVLWTEVPTYEPHPPIYYSLLKIWREFVGDSGFALRSLSLLLAAATIPVVASASAELERLDPSSRPLLRSGMAAFLVACSPMLVLIGEEARPYPLLVFAYAVGSLGVLRLTREFGEGGVGRWRSWLMLSAGVDLALWAHGLGVLYAFSLAGALAPSWLNSSITRERLIRGLVAASAVTLIYLPCLAILMGRAADWGTGWLSWHPDMILQLIGLYTVPFEVFTVAGAIAAFVMVLLTKRAIMTAFGAPGWNANRAVLLLWWAPPFLAIIISQFVIPVFLVRTLTPTVVPAALALSGALAKSDGKAERSAFMAVLAIALMIAAGQVALRPAPEPWDEVAAFLNHNVKHGDQVWLYPNDSALPLREAGIRVPMRGIPGNYPAVGFRGPIRAGSPAVPSITATQSAAFANDRRATRVPRIWLVTRQSELFDPDDEMPKALSRLRRAGRLETWNFINVRPYVRR